MSLERYCREKRPVIQSSSTTAYDAVRALESNHIGAIVVQDQGRVVGIVTDRDLARRVIGFELDPKQTELRDVMTPEPTTISLDATDEEAAKLMRARHVRRLPIVEGNRARGIVTFDDLVMARSVDPIVLAGIVEAQLAEPAPSKPAGVTHPVRTSAQTSAEDTEKRHAARAGRTLNEFKLRVGERLGMADAERALAAFEVVAAGLVRRLDPREASDFAAQLPSALKERLLDLPAGPDFSITSDAIADEMAMRLGIDLDDAASLTRQVAVALPEFVSPGEIEHVKSQLPSELKAMFAPPS